MFVGFPINFTEPMNGNLSKEITVEELGGTITCMAKGKAPGHDGIPIEFFQKLWSTVGQNYLKMIQRGIEDGKLHDGFTI